MHPVVQKCIEIKWRRFGRMDTVRKLAITFLYLVRILYYNMRKFCENFFSRKFPFYLFRDSGGYENKFEHLRNIFKALVYDFHPRINLFANLPLDILKILEGRG